MRLLSIPDDVAIGGIDAQALRLAEDAARAADEAEALVRSLFRGDSSWRSLPLTRIAEEVRPWPRSATGS
ncbi:hypothetical protein [Vulgatibacter incomptus]|uniref:Uncharacterized protein n=1 Tax=Vulgatibacter incomptus TaxID=1391653 RepID=A0A0K1PF69_9BACT|nr:hypothetical protein [Vulgatibacter incomptus]AKU92165.1 hypothetical protein AKJ08_2552 [Vulgatibacter incomptus]